MNSNFNRFSNFPRNQVDAQALASDSVDLYTPMIIQCQTGGDIKYEALNGVAVTRTVVAGEVLVPLVKKIWATGTNVTVITGYY